MINTIAIGWHGFLHPAMRADRPGLWAIAAGLVSIHGALAVSSLLGPHTSAMWVYYGQYGTHGVGFAHAFVALAMAWGISGRMNLVRFGLLTSVGIYLLKFCLFTAAVYRADTSPHPYMLGWEVPIFTAGLALLSALSYWEFSDETAPTLDGS